MDCLGFGPESFSSSFIISRIRSLSKGGGTMKTSAYSSPRPFRPGTGAPCSLIRSFWPDLVPGGMRMVVRPHRVGTSILAPSVAEMYGLHPQTLRLYEREGLLKPSRSEGNTRLYSADDLKRLEIILNLIRDLGVNLAGVEVVLNMRSKIERIEAEVAEFIEYVRREFIQGKEEEFEARRRALVHVRPGGVIKVKSRDE